jgi:hypothetical protein
MKSLGLEGELLEQTMKETRETIINGYSFSGSIKGVFIGSIFWGLIALIVAATQYRVDKTSNFN